MSIVNRKLAGQGQEVVRKRKVNKPSVNQGLAVTLLPASHSRRGSSFVYRKGRYLWRLLADEETEALH